MYHLDPVQSDAFRAAVARVVPGRVTDELAAIYARFAQELTGLDAAPRCDQSGKCCRFDEYGHLLFVTPLEMAGFLVGQGTGAGPDASPAGTALPVLSGTAAVGRGCPFQIGGLCSAHPHRPFGCRIFFCDPAASGWMEGAYERFHAQIRRLHEVYEVPYFYVEWRQALRAVGLMPDAAQKAGGGV